MVKKQVIEMTEEELERDRHRVALEAAEVALQGMKHLLQEVQEGLRAITGVADKATIMRIYGISRRQVERLDKRHQFKRVKGPTTDRNWYDFSDVREKLRG